MQRDNIQELPPDYNVDENDAKSEQSYDERNSVRSEQANERNSTNDDKMIQPAEQKIDLSVRKTIFQDSTEPVTLTWQVSALAPIKKNVFKRLKDRIRPSESETSSAKPILSNGKFKKK
jgi:hypothetical protein